MTIVDGVLYGADARIADWVQRKTGVDPFPEGTAAMGVMHRGKVVAGIVWHDYRGHDIHLTVAADSPRFCRPAVLRQLARYPFVQLGCARITSIVSSRNHAAIRFNEGLGMSLEGVLRRGFDGTHDALVYGVTRDDCRWIPDGLL